MHGTGEFGAEHRDRVVGSEQGELTLLAGGVEVRLTGEDSLEQVTRGGGAIEQGLAERGQLVLPADAGQQVVAEMPVQPGQRGAHRGLVNGTEADHDLLSNMSWMFEDLIAYASRGTWVRTGDVIGSGTSGNRGCLAELWGRRGERVPPPLRPGDVVEMTVEAIGTIRNRVVPGLDLPPVSPARIQPRTREAPHPGS
jgi:Fumarylacetoacetate (FAA) hydrolase family